MVVEAENLSQLQSKENLGDGKLSKWEISYLKQQENLRFKNIGNDLMSDIIQANKNALRNDNVLSIFIEDILSNKNQEINDILQKSWLAWWKAVIDFLSKKPANENERQTQFFVLINLLLYWSKSFPQDQHLLLKNINDLWNCKFMWSTVKTLHRFQKEWEKRRWRSKADCIVGKKTIQQLLVRLGVKSNIQEKVSKKFINPTPLEKNQETGKQVTSELQNLQLLQEKMIQNANHLRWYLDDVVKWRSLNLCSWYALSVVENIANQKGKTTQQKWLSAWRLSNLNKGCFREESVISMNNNNQDIYDKLISLDVGSLIQVRYEWTRSRDSGVSHVIVALWGWNFTDYVSKKSRNFKISKNNIGFIQDGGDGWKRTHFLSVEGSKYYFTEDAKIYVPKYNSMPNFEKKEHVLENITVLEATQNWANKLNLPWEFVYTEVMQHNKYNSDDVYKKQEKVSVFLPSIKVSEYNITQRLEGLKSFQEAEKTHNTSSKTVTAKVKEKVFSIKELENLYYETQKKISQEFLQSLKNNKAKLMEDGWVNNEEYDMIADIAFWILWQESGFWTHEKYYVKKIGWDLLQDLWQIKRKIDRITDKNMDKMGIVESYLNALLDKRVYKDTEYNSKWLTQIKIDSIYKSGNTWLKDKYIKYDITAKSLESPEKAAIGTVLHLIDWYKTLKTYMVWGVNYNKILKQHQSGQRSRPPIEIIQENIMLYLPYMYNKPSEILNSTATPATSKYIASLKKAWVSFDDLLAFDSSLRTWGAILKA